MGRAWNHSAIWSLLNGSGTGYLDGTAIWSITFDATGNIYAGTGSGNVWKYTTLLLGWTAI
jgi:hypothetical protein